MVRIHAGEPTLESNNLQDPDPDAIEPAAQLIDAVQEAREHGFEICWKPIRRGIGSLASLARLQ